MSTTAATAELVKRGRRAVRLLDAIVAPKPASDPELLGTWHAIKRPSALGNVGAPPQSEEAGATSTAKKAA